MSWISVKQAAKAAPGTIVTLKGWVRTRRDSKADGGLSFIAVHDGSCFDTIQVVAKGDIANYADVAKLTTHCAIEATGKIVQNPKGGNEVLVDGAGAGEGAGINIIGLVDDPDKYPIQPKPHSFEFLRELAHLRVRTNTFGAVARVRHTLSMAMHRFFDERGFFYVHTPIVTGSDCEGAGQMFRVSTLDSVNPPRLQAGEGVKGSGVEVSSPKTPSAPGHLDTSAPDFSQDFFGKETHLTVSGQLNVETYCCALSKVYTFGPT
ncbi:MAG: hypothetical protein KF805_16900, partial [Phycisphaeraceae bacterium]|nr:hypothetical protein [Phycisphaeraceae bacterium]